MTQVKQEELDILIGMTETEALNYCTQSGWELRVTKRDGHYGVGTRDMRHDRINVKLIDGHVITADIG
jgi:hypothetical protein